MLWYGNLMFQGDTQGDVAGGWGAVLIEFQNNLAFGSVFFYNNTFVDWNKANYPATGPPPLMLLRPLRITSGSTVIPATS